MSITMSVLNEPYLELSDNPIRFEAVNHVTNVFFDDSNKQIFAVRSGGAMGVVVKGPQVNSPPINFRMADKGPVISIKFSLDQQILAVQRSTTSVEFMILHDLALLDNEFSQSCKKNTNLFGFVWTQNKEVALITDHGIELYLVISEKKMLKHLKSISCIIQWFVWCPQNKIALLASNCGSQLQPVLFKAGSIIKFPKLETDSNRMTLERDVTLANLYGIPAILILRHQSGPQHAEVHIHTLHEVGQSPVKSHVLKLNFSGRFAINVIDDLILVHHQASRTSQIFDINIPGESDGTVIYHNAVAPAKSLRPVSLSLPGLVELETHSCELYSPNWVVFQPNIVIDAKLGCLWHIHLCLDKLCALIADLSLCTQLLLKRTLGKDVLLQVLVDHIKLPEPSLQQLQKSLNYINEIYRQWADAQLSMQIASPPNVPLPNHPPIEARVVIDQSDFYKFVLQELMDEDQLLQNVEWALINYMTSLSEYGISVEINLNELLISTLVRRNKFIVLMQLLQYGVLPDSKPLACLLLSLGNLHASTSQLGLDMLTRLGANEEIQEVLLNEGQLLSALKCTENNASPRKFLEAAQNSGKAALVHSTYFWFQLNTQYNNAIIKSKKL